MSELEPVGIPVRFRATCTPTEVWLRVYGVQLGAWSCPNCGTMPEERHYPHPNCPGCSRPFGRRCITKACSNIVEPEPAPKGRDGIVSAWHDIGPICRSCETADAQSRALSVWRAQTPDRIATLATTAWKAQPWHTGELTKWAENRVSKPTLYLYGDIGIGKTVGAARLAHELVVKSQSCESMFWTSEADIIRAHEQRYSESAEAAANANACLAATRSCDLLVIDELFRRPVAHYTPKALIALGEVLYDRFERWRLTIITSNEAPPFERYFDARIDSRFAAVSTSVRARGLDQRRGAG